MKKCLPLFFLLFTVSMIGQEFQDWKWLHEKPQGNTLRYVKMWDANNWYVLGYSGTFMKTTDGGATGYFHHKAGRPRTDGSTSYIYDAHFFDQNTGVVVGTGGVMRTTNGGLTFDTVTTNIASGATAYQVYFLNANVGYLAGTSTSRIAKTTDGGLTWTINSVITSATYYDVWSPDENIIVAATTAGNIRRSTDAGLTWATISTGASATLYKLEFQNATTGWVVGSTGTPRYTTDAGETWTTPANVGLPASTYYDIDFVGTEIWLTGDANNLYKTTDNGATWQAVSHIAASQPWTSTYYAADFLGTKIVAVGAFGLLNSKTGTANPVCHTYFEKAGTIYDVWVNQGTIITVGAPTITGSTFDQIFISTNGGSTWGFPTIGDRVSSEPLHTFVPPIEENEIINSKEQDQLTPNTTSIFRSIEMISNTTGFAVGSNGAIYKTTNKGLNWDSLVTTIPVTANLFKVDFINPLVGWVFNNVTDETGTIWKTTDGGATWAQQILTGQTGSNTRIYGAHMVNENYGWCVNYKPRPYKTTDGGATWVEQPLSDAYGGFLYDVEMIDTLLGYCVGGSGRVYKTTDGGTMWNVLTTPIGTSNTNYDVDFFDANVGIVAGSLGVMLYTTDGGTTWTLENTTGAATNYAAFIEYPITDLDTASVYAVGASSFIFKKDYFTVPVELSSFSAVISGLDITLNWSTATETNNFGFDIERSSEGTSWMKIGFINGRGTSTEVSAYSFTDKNLQAGKYNYRIKQIDFDGTYKYYNLSETIEVSIPVEFSLSQNYPNPFNPVTKIIYSVPFSSEVTLKVYDILGNEIAVLVNSRKEAGRYEVQFDGSNFSSGVYFYELKSNQFTSIKKLILMK